MVLNREEAPMKATDVALILKSHLNESEKSGPVTFSIDRVLVNKEKNVAVSVDVYYTVAYGDKTLPAFTQIKYETFRTEAGGFARLFEHIASEMFNEIKEE